MALAIRRRDFSDFKFYYYCSMSTTERAVIHNIVRSQGEIPNTQNAENVDFGGCLDD
jgi:hypothetical protein